MKAYGKASSILLIIFSLITIISAILYFLHYVSIDIVMLFLGFTQLFNGLKEISKVRQTELKRDNKISKAAGPFSMVLGIIIVIAVIFKILI